MGYVQKAKKAYQTGMTLSGVSVVICCHNSANRLPETLSHLKTQEVPVNIPWEVLLIDNASTDQTSRAAIEIWNDFGGASLRVVQEPQLGLIHARMRGFQEARFEFVSFIDDDNWVNPDWVEKAYQVMMDHPDVGACGGRSEAVFEVEPPSWFERYQKWYAVGDQTVGQGDITWTRGCLWGAGLTIRKTAWTFLQENGFTPILSGRSGTRLTSGEDIELCLALRLAEWRLWYEKSLFLKHYITKGRLNWRYLRKLLRGNGASSISINPYKLVLKEDRSIPGDYGKKWVWKLRYEVTNLFRARKKWLLSKYQVCEGDDEVLKVEILEGVIREIFRQRGNYDKHINSIRNAKWNQINSMVESSKKYIPPLKDK